MDVKCINPFMGAIKNVFQTMLSVDVQFGKPQVKKEATISHDVSGIIGLSGDVEGVVIVSFPKLSALKIASTFAGIALSDIDEDFADAIGELANMIAGNAKKDFEGLDVMISIPSVVIGSGHMVKNSRVLPRLIIPCTCPMGSFVVEVGMRTLNKPKDLAVESNAELMI
jgi:chemotaxis protein CheX